MQLLPEGELARLIDIPDGCLFLHGDKIALKTTYLNVMGRIEAFYVDTGEFVGGLSSRDRDEVNHLVVQPLRLIE